MSGRRPWMAAALCLLALPALAQSQKQGVVMQPMTLRPDVDLLSPADGAHFVTGKTVVLDAIGYAMTGGITRMDLYVDGALYASTTTSDEIVANWTATLGTHTVSAKATDEALSRQTPNITITVTANTLPTVSLTGPAGGSVYAVGATVPMIATASDSDGTINRVEFWVDGAKVGEDTSNPYAYNWAATVGSHSVVARAIDDANGTTSTSAITIRGNAVPTTSLTAPANGAAFTTGDAVTLSATASDSDGTVTKVEFYLDGNLYATDTSSPFTQSWTATSGPHTVKAKAYDNDGGVSAFSGQASITVNTPPTVSLTAPTNGTSAITGTTATFSATASDSDGTITKVEFYLDGALYATDTVSPFSQAWTVAAGAHIVKAKAYDNSSGISAFSNQSTITGVANTPPTATLTAPANGASYATGATVAMTATASDSDGTVAKVEFWVDGVKQGEDTNSPYTYNWVATNGDHALVAKAVDNLSATGSSSTATIHVNTLPTISLTAPANGATFNTGATATFSATASDSDGTITKVEFYLDGSLYATDTASPFSQAWTTTVGTHTVKAKAYDNSGGVSAFSSQAGITVNTAPTVTLTAPANGATFNTGATATFSATASDSDGTITKVEFYLDGSLYATDTVSPYSQTWTTTAGTHTVKAKAYDNLGGVSAFSSQSSISVNTPPTVSVTAPADGTVFPPGVEQASFTAAASDSDGTIVRVEFLIDGTQVGQDTVAPYSYPWWPGIGTFVLQARAVDNLGGTTTSAPVTVTVPPPNHAPTVTLTAPSAGASFLTGTTASMTATASDDDGTVTRVEFWVDGAKKGEDTTSPYAYDWIVAGMPGSHTMQARAFDDDLGSSASTTITIQLADSNLDPYVDLMSPSNGASYGLGAEVPLSASASDPDGTIAKVEFLVDGAVVSTDTGSPYDTIWDAMAAGTYTVQARATDNFGATRTTDSVSFTVTTTPAPLTLTRKYTYNAYQELCRVVEREIGNTPGEREGATLIGYDPAGNLKWSASGLPKDTACSDDGNTPAISARSAVRTYDARNRIVKLEFPDLNGNQEWQYTPDGLPASVKTWNDAGANYVTNTYAYNKRRLLTGESQASGSNTWTVGYGYDANASLSTLVYPDSLTVAYAPNALGQPTQAGSYATNVTYYPNGAIAGFTYGNLVVHSLSQNARGLPDRSQDMNGATPVHDDGYDYDPVGNVAAISDAVAGNRGTRDMTYDSLNRLTRVTGDSGAPSPMFGIATYAYDVLDNLTHVAVTGGSQVRDQTYVYDAHNRLTNLMAGGVSVVGLGYDAQGNLTNKNGVFYTFDYGNRMRAGGPESYRYDVQGRRIRSSSSAGVIYSLYAQSGQLLFQRDERSGKRRQYVYLGGSLVAESSVPLAGGAATVTYQHTDALGSPVATTNSAKTVLQRSEYEPYGYLLNRVMEDGPGYTGHVTDAATGLVYMQQRYYDPVIGRFDSVDAVTALQGGPHHFNSYDYAYNNPYKFTDPDGRCPQGQACHEAVDQSIAAKVGRALGTFFGNMVAGFRSDRTNPITHEILSPGQAFDARVSTLTLMPVARVESAAARIADDALVVRGGSAAGANSVDGLAKGTSTHPTAGVTGFSAESANGATFCQLCQNVTHNQVGTTTAGAVRAAGGDVVSTPGVSPTHATVTGLTPEAANRLLTPTTLNPIPTAERLQR